jgi:CheY-like chemotaxis protein
MPAQRVLVVDENQSFCMQVVAAFSEVGIEARGSARGNEALLLAASFHPDLIVVDLVRPGSEGRWLLGRLYAEDDETPVAMAPRLVLALAPVAGDYSGLPDGVEVVVKPIFPGQVVASACLLLGPMPDAGGLPSPLSGPASRPPTSSSPGLASPSGPSLFDGGLLLREMPAVEHMLPPTPGAVDPFDDDSDFGPADTLLAPAASISELARSMVHIPDPQAEAERAALQDSIATVLLNNSGEETVPLAEFDLRSELAHRLELGLPKSSSPEAAPRSQPLPQSGWPQFSSGPIDVREALSGSLGAVPLLDVLGLLSRQCQTGIVRVSSAAGMSFAGGPLARRFLLVLRRGQLEQVVAVGMPAGAGGRRRHAEPAARALRAGAGDPASARARRGRRCARSPARAPSPR